MRHLNIERKFITHELDVLHLVVDSSAVSGIKTRVENEQSSNTFDKREAEMLAAKKAGRG